MHVSIRIDGFFRVKALLMHPRESYSKTRLNSRICSLVPMTVREESLGIT